MNLPRRTAEYFSHRVSFKAHLPGRFGQYGYYVFRDDHPTVLKAGDRVWSPSYSAILHSTHRHGN